LKRTVVKAGDVEKGEPTGASSERNENEDERGSENITDATGVSTETASVEKVGNNP
jgi:hypothetical protein